MNGVPVSQPPTRGPWPPLASARAEAGVDIAAARTAGLDGPRSCHPVTRYLWDLLLPQSPEDLPILPRQHDRAEPPRTVLVDLDASTELRELIKKTELVRQVVAGHAL